ncbi:MAG TPA: hypothetical protein VK638_55100, partial [Edaphobacter sp.]|nr:hypothetical protein [Edaphobacter sp.]
SADGSFIGDRVKVICRTRAVGLPSATQDRLERGSTLTSVGLDIISLQTSQPQADVWILAQRHLLRAAIANKQRSGDAFPVEEAERFIVEQQHRNSCTFAN